MKLLPSQATRKEYVRRIKGFWESYSRSKIGLIGLAILVLYVSVALFAPLLTPYDPNQSKYLAESLAMPQWVTIFPQFSDLPPTTTILPLWEVENGSASVKVEANNATIIRYTTVGGEKADVYLKYTFDYTYTSPRTFKPSLKYGSLTQNQTGYSLELVLISPQGSSYSLWDSYYGFKTQKLQDIPLLKKDTTTTRSATTDSWDVNLWDRLGWTATADYPTLASQVFNDKGEYELLLHAVFEPLTSNATCQITLKATQILIPGLVHGLLGTDQYGGDLFSQLVYSTQTSLTIGLVTAAATTAIGVIVGVAAGYVGGVVDEFIMRITDVVLCIPLLPILITLAVLFGANLYLIIGLLSLLWWPSLARVVRSLVLSLREKTFVVSARAIGAGRLHIMIKHLIPNVLPVAFAAMILDVSFAIITEAVISFIGITPLSVPTWGKMLHYAFYAGAFQRFAWWWIVPPGLALTFLALSFAFVAHAVDEIINPRLRMRR